MSTKLLETIKILMPEPFDWSYIPSGKVTLEAGGYVPEGGQSFDVDAFYIAKYPVTNAQFAKFINAGAYTQYKWWTHKAWSICQREEWSKPNFWNEIAFSGDDKPVVGVSWFEALAFCSWLSYSLTIASEQRWNYQLVLPTEQQWQRAAQGDDGRLYPWGNELDSSRANIGSQLGETSSVMAYPSGLSPFGVFDLLGNVSEWCSTHYETGTQNYDVSSLAHRIYRGGSWDDITTDVSVTYREAEYPDTRSESIGFRICLNIADSSES